MQISWHLRKLLSNHGLDDRGIIVRISEEAKIHRTAVSNIYHNTAPNVSLETLEKLCDWLRKHRIPADLLPGGLLAKRPASLFDALALPGTIQFVISEYRLRDDRQPTYRWVARRDVDVAASLIERLSDPAEVATLPTVRQRYAAYHKPEGKEFPEDKWFRDDVDGAARILRELHENARHASAVLIGSQQPNFCVELAVAEMFNRKPFQPADGEPAVPFYKVYRENEPNLPSCFGGPNRPDNQKKPTQKDFGIYYRTEPGTWNLVQWIYRQKDASVVITDHDITTGAFMLIIVGYSGLATAATGAEVARHPDKFWTKSPDAPRSVINICRLEYADRDSGDPEADPEVRDFKVVHRITLSDQPAGQS